MTRDQQDEQIWLYAAGALDGAEADAVRKLLAEGDPADAAAYAEAMSTISHLPLALDAIEPPKAARDRLLSRVAASQSSGGRSWIAWTLTGIAAAAALFLAVRVSQLTYELERQRVMLAARELQLVALSPGQAASKARGRVFWDKQANEWHVFVFDMAPPPPGKVFELWMIGTDGKPLPAGTFQVDARGNGSIVSKVPPNLTQIALAAITAEPGPNGVDAPTGAVELSGRAN